MRADALRKAEETVSDCELKQRLKCAAQGYEQCLEELKHPPEQLIIDLGIAHELS